MMRRQKTSVTKTSKDIVKVWTSQLSCRQELLRKLVNRSFQECQIVSFGVIALSAISSHQNLVAEGGFWTL